MRIALRRGLALALVAGSAVPGDARAYEPPKLLSLGGAETALALGNDAFYRNPAGIALGNFYSIELGYFDELTGKDRQFSASVTDGFDKSIAGGVGYVFRDRKREPFGADPEREATSHRFDVALAVQVAEGFALGMSARFMTVTDDVGGVDIEPSGFQEFSFDAGLAWKTAVGLTFGVVGRNLTDSAQPELPMTLGGGIGFGYEIFTVEGDVDYSFDTERPTMSFGTSFLIGGTVALRGGFVYDFATESAAISAGVGVANAQFGADFGFRQKVFGPGNEAPGLNTERLFGISVRGMPFL